MGKAVNWFRERVIELRLSSDARRPSGNVAMQLFSTLNSSRRMELARERGIDPHFNLLYLNNRVSFSINLANLFLMLVTSSMALNVLLYVILNPRLCTLG